MWDDFDDDDEGSWDEDDEDNFRKEHEKIYKHPLMKKAKNIRALTRALVGSLDEARRELYGNIMHQDAMLISSKFAAAESTSDFVSKMEKAVFIKVHAKNLNGMTYQLAMEETHAEEHLELLRAAIEEYRILFIEWVSALDPDEKMDDGWGIFTN
jgi:hypothetical protein